MKLNTKKIIKSSLLSLAVLDMIGGSINSNVASAKHRYHYRTHSHAKRIHRNRRSSYWKVYRRHDHKHYVWIRKSHRSGHRYRKRAKARQHVSRHHRSSARRFNPYKDGESKEDREWDRVMWGTSYNPKYKKYFQKHGEYYNIKRTKRHQRTWQRAKHHTTIRRNLTEMKQQTLTDINNDRQSRGVAPLAESPELDQIASMRAKQEQSYQGHIDPNTGNSFDDEDGYKLGYNSAPSNEKYGENLDEANTGSYKLDDGTPVTNQNGYDLANSTNNDLMNHDASSNWGHRENILHSGYSTIGIGVSYGTHSPDKSFPYKLVENFSD